VELYRYALNELVYSIVGSLIFVNHAVSFPFFLIEENFVAMNLFRLIFISFLQHQGDIIIKSNRFFLKKCWKLLWKMCYRHQNRIHLLDRTLTGIRSELKQRTSVSIVKTNVLK